MKLVPFVLLICLALPLGAGAKTRAKHGHKSRSPAAAPQPAKGQLIDMTADGGVLADGLISTSLSGRDVEFFETASEVGSLQAWLGEQAKVRGEADKVKAVGDTLQSTQAGENKLLADLAKRKGVPLPETPPRASGWKQAEEQLAKASGADFDKAVLEQIGTVTQQSYEAYQGAAKSEDADIQRFAQQILPMLKQKLVLVKTLAGKALPPGSRPGFREHVPPPPR